MKERLPVITPWTVLEKTLENPLDSKDIPPNPKANKSEYLLVMGFPCGSAGKELPAM